MNDKHIMVLALYMTHNEENVKIICNLVRSDKSIEIFISSEIKFPKNINYRKMRETIRIHQLQQNHNCDIITVCDTGITSSKHVTTNIGTKRGIISLKERLIEIDINSSLEFIVMDYIWANPSYIKTRFGK